VTESQLVSIVTAVAVISVRQAKRPKEYLNTEYIIKELKMSSCVAEEIIEQREQKTSAQSIQYYAQEVFTDKDVVSLCVRKKPGWVKTYLLIYS